MTHSFGHTSRRKRGSKLLAVFAATAALVIAPLVVTQTAASADVPTPGVSEPFNAPLCASSPVNGTASDPTDADGAISDLTTVFGARLDAYNAGKVVPLYDSWGMNAGAFPPLCGTRYVESAGGPVSEWMFCTDMMSHTCGETLEDGSLVGERNDGGLIPISPLEPQVKNPKLSAEQERVISYLVQNDHSYTGFGGYESYGATTATANQGSNERVALQYLIWCISDPNHPELAGFDQTCEFNMGLAEQNRILALTPQNASVSLAFSGSNQNLAVGQTVQFVLTTNVYNQPISVTSSPAGAFQVCGGTADLDGDTLTVAGTDSSVTTAITLCYSAQSAGETSITASATPAAVTHLTWDQSTELVPGTLDKPCQVFGTFRTTADTAVTASADAVFAPAATTAPATTAPATTGPATTAAGTAAAAAGTLASTGTDALSLGTIAILLTLIGGAVVSALVVKRRGSAASR